MTFFLLLLQLNLGSEPSASNLTKDEEEKEESPTKEAVDIDTGEEQDLSEER